MENSFKFSENGDNAYVCLKNCMLMYQEAEKRGFQNISPREGMELGYDTMFVFLIFAKEILELELTEEEKIAVEITLKFKYREYIDPIEKYYRLLTIWKNDNGDLMYTLEDVNDRSKTHDKTYEKADSQLVPSEKTFFHTRTVLQKLVNRFIDKITF